MCDDRAADGWRRGVPGLGPPVPGAVRAVVVGTGFGARVHVPALQRAGFDVVALVGRDQTKTARRAARAGVANASASLRDALDLGDINAVIVASPPATHLPLGLEAIAAGCHVVIEKPFTLDADAARTLSDAAAEAGVVGLVHHEFRFAPERVAITRALAAGAVGEPRLATFVWHLELVAAPAARAPEWWWDSARGGGWLNACVPHFADIVRVWFGDIAVVNAALPMVSDRDPSRFAEDTALIRFRSESGCEGVIAMSAAIWGEEFQTMRIAGTTGNLVAGTDSVAVCTADGRRLLALDAPAASADFSDDPRHQFTHLELPPAVLQAQAFRRLIEGGRIEDEPLAPATFADGVASIEFLDAARRSAAADGASIAVTQSLR
jgi:predicted dehydrogenase